MTKKRQTLNPDLQDLKVACNIKSIIYICLIPFIVLFKYELIHVLCLSLPLLSLSLSLSLSLLTVLDYGYLKFLTSMELIS